MQRKFTVATNLAGYFYLFRTETPFLIVTKLKISVLHILLAVMAFNYQFALATDLRISPFTIKNEKVPRLDALAKKYTVLSYNQEAMKAVYADRPHQITLKIPTQYGVTELVFQPNEIRAEGFSVLNSKGKDVTSTIQRPLHFKGADNKRGKKMAALTIFSDGHLVLVFSNNNGNYNCSQLPSSKSGEYILFNDADLLAKNPFNCTAEGKLSEQGEKRIAPKSHEIQNDTTCRLTEIYWECDHDMYTKGGSIQGTLNQFEAMFNGTAILYELESINIGVKAVKVWDTPDPYSYNTSFTALGDFQDAGNAANWPGQLAHLLSTLPRNLGGVAFLDAICTSFRYGFSNIDFLFSPLPVYSWTLSTIAHELGHNFSSPHTHNCNWVFPNGEVHQIDSCWEAEGGCQDEIHGRVGTIMSYCHLTGSVNLSLGFGPLPGNRIRQGFADMPCVSGSIVVPPFLPTNSGPFCVDDTIRLSAEELIGYTYKWTGPGGFQSLSRQSEIPNATEQNEGFYTLTVKRSACESRPKKTEVVFNCLKIGTIPSSICAGSLISVPVTTTGVFNPGNQFIAQLSNASGSFANPINLDTIAGTIPQTYNLAIPDYLSLGSGFRFRFLSTNPSYTGKPVAKPFTINTAGNSPTPLNGERCGPGSVKLSANGATNFAWYPNKTDLLPLALAKVYQTPDINQTTSYFVQASATIRSKTGLPKAMATGTFSNNTDGLIFNVISGFRLDSVTLIGQVSPQPSLTTLQLISNGSVLYQSSVNLDQEVKKVALFWRIDPGTDYRLVCLGSNLLRKAPSGWGTFPIKINGLITITSSVNNPLSGDYPYLYDLIIQKYAGCPSKRVEVKGIIRQGEPPVVPVVQLTGSDSVLCSQPGLLYEWLINGVVISTSQRKFKALVNSSYQVRYKTDSCFSDWSQPFTFTVSGIGNISKSERPDLFPNPAQSILNWNFHEPAEIFLLDVAGKKIWSKEASLEERFDISTLPKGIYGVRWRSQNNSGLIRFVKD